MRCFCTVAPPAQVHPSVSGVSSPSPSRATICSRSINSPVRRDCVSRKCASLLQSGSRRPWLLSAAGTTPYRVSPLSPHPRLPWGPQGCESRSLSPPAAPSLVLKGVRQAQAASLSRREGAFPVPNYRERPGSGGWGCSEPLQTAMGGPAEEVGKGTRSPAPQSHGTGLRVHSSLCVQVGGAPGRSPGSHGLWSHHSRDNTTCGLCTRTHCPRRVTSRGPRT